MKRKNSIQIFLTEQKKGFSHYNHKILLASGNK